MRLPSENWKEQDLLRLRSQLRSSSQLSTDSVAVSSEREIRSRRKHISKAQRRLIWEYLDEKYGLPRHCYAAGCARTDVQQDHKDGNRNNTVLQNMQPSCPIHQKVRTVARKKEREWGRT